ncbi:hypothetical protein K438DRAFT_806365 [Mycena galopus ATCC 62051]|nr:hypothetical protein K438DRAFT_806365 [Mycena galopus ATCC 62051]
MSATPSPGDPESDVVEGNGEDNENGDAIVVLTPDTATLERALAERAAKRQAVAAKKRQTAADKLTFGVTLMKIKNYEGAAACFAEACKLWRANPVAHCDLATAYLHLGRWVSAGAYFASFHFIRGRQIPGRGRGCVDGAGAGPEARRGALCTRHGSQGARKRSRRNCR